ncbi:MAG: Uma2 family endonuclease [Planctomycetales bacterium]
MSTTLLFADLIEQFGFIPTWRVRIDPPPGTASVRDVVRIHDRENRLCELVNGTLIEKSMGYEDSVIASALLVCLGNFVNSQKLGIVTGEGGMLKLGRGLVRIPDVAFVSYERLPGRRVPRAPIPTLVPNLAVEVLSRANTSREMRQKLRDYFSAGVELVWYIDPRKHTITVYTDCDQRTLLKESQTLTGGEVLPGFRVKVRDLFAQLSQE